MVIVGDHCTDDTPDLIAKIKDPRIRFYNLPERPPYPKKGLKRYRSVGTVASNTALDLACGSWIAHMDDDDVLTPDHIETLLTHARSGNYEFVSGRIRLEKRPGEWVEQGGGLILNGGLKGHISHSTVLYRSYLRFLKYDIQAWKLGMAGDTHLWRRMRNAGVRAGFVSQVVAILPLRPGETVRSICQPE
jgi:glycosyltransferase involved in cell wall biosynthesis